MISIEEQQKLFIEISRRLDKEITVYAIGGTAMMFLGIKDSTLDIDLVFETERDKEVFKDAIKPLGYSNIDSAIVYGGKTNAPEMMKRGDERFDLFVINVIDFIFSDTMQQRAEQIYQFGANLILKVADSHDIILMKCATDRLKDRDDAKKIIESSKIDWQTIVNEAKKQINLGKTDTAWELGYFLEDLKNDLKVEVPQVVLDELFGILKNQIEKRKKNI